MQARVHEEKVTYVQHLHADLMWNRFRVPLRPCWDHSRTTLASIWGQLVLRASLSIKDAPVVCWNDNCKNDPKRYALNEGGSWTQMLVIWNVCFQEGHTKPIPTRSSHFAMQESYTPYGIACEANRIDVLAGKCIMNRLRSPNKVLINRSGLMTTICAEMCLTYQTQITCRPACTKRKVTYVQHFHADLK